MADTKANTALTETKTDEKLKLVFSTYDKYGREETKTIDITDLVKKEIGDDLPAAMRVFAGIRHEFCDGAANYPMYRNDDGAQLKNHVKDMTTTAIVNARQLDAMDRQIDEFFHNFSKRMFDRFWL